MSEKRTKKPEFSEPIRCGHCMNYAPMKIGAIYSTVRSIYDDDLQASLTEGYIYKLLECPSCQNLTLTKDYINEAIPDEELSVTEFLFPVDDKFPEGMPIPIRIAYSAALKVKTIDANAFGVLIGRMLEMICEDRKAKGHTLNEKLSDLSSKGEIPVNLVGVANGLRNMRNIGAHAGLGELTEEEIPILNNLSKAIIEYVYSAPYLANLAQKRLMDLKKKKKR
jgi:hypothetical protein